MAEADGTLGARVQAAVGALTSAVASLSGIGGSGDAAELRDRPERVLSASFGVLEAPGGAHCRVLLLVYASGWQAWEVETAGACRELVSLRDGAVTSVLPVPHPERSVARCDDAADGEAALPDDARPLVAVAGPDAPPPPPAEELAEGAEGAGAPLALPHCGASAVRFFSLRRQEYVKTCAFRSPVLALRATPRVVAVALESQVYGLDTATLEARPAASKMSVGAHTARSLSLTRADTHACLLCRSPFRCSPTAALRPRRRSPAASGARAHARVRLRARASKTPRPKLNALLCLCFRSVLPVGPLALGPRWLAYASTEAPSAGAGRAAPQPLLSGSPGGGGGAAMVAHYAKLGGKHLAHGVMKGKRLIGACCYICI